MSVVKQGRITGLLQIWKKENKPYNVKNILLLVGQNLSDKSMFLNKKIIQATKYLVFPEGM